MLKVVEDVPEEQEEEDDVTEIAAAAEKWQEMTEADLEREAQLLSKLSAQQIRLILEDVCTEMLSGLEVPASNCLRSAYCFEINRLQRVYSC